MALSFEQWMQKVDKILDLKIGLESQDIGDYLYADAYEQGFTPEQAAEAAIANDPDIDPDDDSTDPDADDFDDDDDDLTADQLYNDIYEPEDHK